MIVYESDWIIDAPRDAVWAALHPQKTFDRATTTVATPRLIEHGTVRIEVVSEGDENGNGLVRRCWFAAPWYVGGGSRSWEIVSEVQPPHYQRYDVLFTTPPAAQALGWYRLEDLSDRRTRLWFHEEYRMERRWLAKLIERRVHRYFSKDNDVNLKGIIDDGLLRQSRLDSRVAYGDKDA